MSHALDPGGWPARDIPLLQILAPGKREWVLRMFFPARCVLCDAVMSPDSGLLLCEPCRCVLEPEPPVWQACPDWPELDAWYSPFPYAGGVEHAIRQMKYNGQPRHARTLAFLLAQAIREMPECPDFSAVVPVPMHPRKQRTRGYNQASLLAEGVAAELQVPLLTTFLAKGRPTRAQNGQDRAERLAALAGSFVPYADADLPASGTVLLVDDVTTTGSTLCACAGVMRQAWRAAGNHGSSFRIHAITVAFA
jgi:predicted amidophosphoribosyltransferase